MEVPLPSGYRVRGVIPGLAALAARDLLDTRAKQAVLRLAASRYVTETEPETTDDWQTAIDAFVAGFPREALDPGAEEWLPVSLAVEDLPNLDQRDRHVLQLLVLRVSTPEDIEEAVEAGEWQVAEEDGELDKLAEFRDESGGAADSGDGESVEPAPVGAASG